MISEHSDLRALFEASVGTDNVRPAGAADAVLGRQPAWVVAPESAEAAAAALRTAGEQGLHVLPRGGGTKQRWGNIPRAADIVLSTEHLKRLIEHSHGDMTATVEAGMAIGALQRALAGHGQMLAIDPAWPEQATLGGIVATNAAGPLRLRYGSMRDLLIGVEVALPDGTLARGGGKVVKNVAGYDLMKLFTGSLGTLGLITSATVRLHPLPEAIASLRLEADSAGAAHAFVIDLQASPLTPTGMQIVSTNGRYSLYVRFSGVEASVVAQSNSLLDRARQAGLAVQALDEGASHITWQAHASIFADADGAIVAGFSVLPTSVGATLEMCDQVAGRLRLAVRIVAQATGTGLVRFEGGGEQALVAAAGTARARIVEQGGTMVLLSMPEGVGKEIDVWGSAGDALPLMRRVKAQFDLQGIMNPGRYIGRL